jgi:hypothetical protein
MFSSSSELTSETFAATLNEGTRFMDLRVSPNQSARVQEIGEEIAGNTTKWTADG